MLHLDPDNLKDPKWQHAVYKLPCPQPDSLDIPWEDWQTHCKARKYHIRFRAKSDLPPVLRNTAEEAKCLDRDGHKCVATGKSSPRVFYFIPFTWNDTFEHMNATGSVRGGAILADTDLLSGPDPAVSVTKLGATHVAWNMLSIDSVLYSYLKDGLCAFRYAKGQEQLLGEGRVQVTLNLYWMPMLKGRFGLLMDLDKDWPTLCGELARFENCSQESFEYGKLRTEAKAPVLSGHAVKITLPEDDVTQFKNAVNVHWASIVFTAVCGAAGRPWLLSGDDPEDESMMKRQDKARFEEDGQRKTIRKTLNLATSTISKGKRKIARLAGKKLITTRTEVVTDR